MDDYKIANNESIKKLNEQYKKIKMDSENIKTLNLEFSAEEQKALSDIIENFKIEKRLVLHYNNKNEPLNECVNILKRIFVLLDGLSFNTALEPYENFIASSFREVFTYNFNIIKNANKILSSSKNDYAKSTLNKVKLLQLELLSLLLPFCIFN